MTTNPNEWMKNEILNGLSKLLTLSLERQPSFELIEGTGATWLEALSAGKLWDRDRDTRRIRNAFSELAIMSSQWPVPRDFMAVLRPPSKPTFTAIGHERPTGPQSVSPYVQKIIEDLAKSLSVASPLKYPLVRPIDEAHP